MLFSARSVLLQHLSTVHQASVTPQFHPHPETTGENPTVTGCFSTLYCPSREFLPVDPLSLSLSLSLSGEVMWGTSCGPYLSCPVVLILPWLFDCQEEQAGRQSGLGECKAGRVSRARALGVGGLGKLKSSANSWPVVGLKAWGSATLNIAKEKRKCI